MGNLPQGMDPGIGTACGGNNRRGGVKPRERGFDRGLNRGLVGLPLPARERAAMIFDPEGIARHTREVTRGEGVGNGIGRPGLRLLQPRPAPTPPTHPPRRPRCAGPPCGVSAGLCARVTKVDVFPHGPGRRYPRSLFSRGVRRQASGLRPQAAGSGLAAISSISVRNPAMMRAASSAPFSALAALALPTGPLGFRSSAIQAAFARAPCSAR